MGDFSLIINVKLPFIEAIEHLLDEAEYSGIVREGGRTIYVNNGELFVKEQNRSTNLNVSDVLHTEWFLIMRNNRQKKGEE